ncbi:MAG: restriction endonuclease, partial [Caulobacteraceae bacterium]|nr:restriction endonuclease [Caulobacter sp.]
GWVGCNILLGEVPEAGKVAVIREGVALPKAEVLARFRETLFLREAGSGARGWLIEVLKVVERIGAPAFSLDDVYAAEDRLARLYPGNSNVRPKIRQQLQVLRDRGLLVFEGRGRYRLAGRG